MWLEGSQSRKQIENGHLDQRVFTSPVFQHPPTHLAKEHSKQRYSSRFSWGVDELDDNRLVS